MKRVILLSDYEDLDSRSLSMSIASKLEVNEKVILDFNGIREVDFTVLENLFIEILDNRGYEKIKTRFGFKNVTPKIKNSISFIIGEYLKER